MQHTIKIYVSVAQLVAACLQKDPSKRPTARALLDHRFFRQAKDSLYIRQMLLEGLPPLEERFRRLPEGRLHGLHRSDECLDLQDRFKAYVADLADWDFSELVTVVDG